MVATLKKKKNYLKHQIWLSIKMDNLSAGHEQRPANTQKIKMHEKIKI